MVLIEALLAGETIDIKRAPFSSITMKEKDWIMFFKLLARIVKQPGTQEEKASKVKDAAAKLGKHAVEALEEITTWDWE